MSLNVALELGRSNLIVGEDAPLAFVFTNASGGPLTIRDPQQNPDWPQLRVVNRQTGRQTSFRPFEVMSRRSNEFMPVMLEINITLDPGQSVRVETSLNRRMETDGPGQYELTAAFEHPGGVATSSSVAVTIEPLALRSAEIAGGHSGHNPYRYCVWSHAADAGSVVVLTCGSFDQHGHPIVAFSTRLLELDHVAEPVISTTPNRLPYPRQWIVWKKGDDLLAAYVNNGKVELKAPPQPLGVANARFIAPPLLDLTGNDGSRPGRCEVALWSSASGRNRVVFRTIESDGRLTSGPEFVAESGTLRWARAAAVSGGERRCFMVTSEGGDSALSLLRWDGAAAGQTGHEAGPQVSQIIARWEGEAIGAGIMMNDNDTVLGAALLERRTGDEPSYWLRSWRTTGDGQTTESPAVAVRRPRDVTFDRAIVELSAEGNVAGILHGSDGRWHVCNRGGDVAPLRDELRKFGEPISAFWLYEREPLLVMAGPQTGVTYQDIHAHH